MIIIVRLLDYLTTSTGCNLDKLVEGNQCSFLPILQLKGSRHHSVTKTDLHGDIILLFLAANISRAKCGAPVRDLGVLVSLACLAVRKAYSQSIIFLEETKLKLLELDLSWKYN